MGNREKAVCLVSGGLDSATALGVAISEGYECTAVSFDYGQRHIKELARSRAIAASYGVKHMRASMPTIFGSALTGQGDIRTTGVEDDIPETYVPGRNLAMTAIAASLAESMGASVIFSGFNAVDYSGYPDCRPEFVSALNALLMVGTKSGVDGNPITLRAPLIGLSKADIIRKAEALKVPLELTWSCYKGGAEPCGLCDSCRIRAQGFADAGMRDPALQGASHG